MHAKCRDLLQRRIPAATSHLNWYGKFCNLPSNTKVGKWGVQIRSAQYTNLDTRIVGNLWPHAATPRTRGRVEAWRCATRQELRRNAAAAAAGMGITGASVNTWQIPLPHCQGKANKNNTLKKTGFIGICSKSPHLDINLVPTLDKTPGTNLNQIEH